MALAKVHCTTVAEVVDLNVFVILNFFDQVYVYLLGKLVLRFNLVENCSDFFVVQMYMGKLLGLVCSLLLNRHGIFGCCGLESPMGLDPFCFVQFMPSNRDLTFSFEGRRLQRVFRILYLLKEIFFICTS